MGSHDISLDTGLSTGVNDVAVSVYQHRIRAAELQPKQELPAGIPGLEEHQTLDGESSQSFVRRFADQALCVKDRQHRIVAATQAYCEIFFRKQVVGDLETDFTPEYFHSAIQQADAYIEAEMQPYMFEVNLQRASNEANDSVLKFFKSPFVNRAGEFIGSLGVIYTANTRVDPVYLRKKFLAQKLNSLSNREQVLVRQISCGVLNKQMAKQFDVTQRTIENWRRNAMQKLEVDSIATLTRLVVEMENTGLMRNQR